MSDHDRQEYFDFQNLGRGLNADRYRIDAITIDTTSGRWELARSTETRAGYAAAYIEHNMLRHARVLIIHADYPGGVRVITLREHQIRSCRIISRRPSGSTFEHLYHGRGE